MVERREDTRFIPRRRTKLAKYISIAIFVLTSVIVVFFGFFFNHSDHKKNLSYLLATLIELISVVIGTLIDRSVLMFEEIRHRHQRYDKSWIKMVKACFGGIKRSVLVVTVGLTVVLIVVVIVEKGAPYWESAYVLHIVSGIGVAPLIMNLLHLNEPCEVDFTTLLEERETRPGQILAWNYYLSDLKEALSRFKEARTDSFPSPHENCKLSSPKLLLLVQLGHKMKDNLKNVDDKINKLFDLNDEFPIYELQVSGDKQKYVAIRNIWVPLTTLCSMRELSDPKAVNKDNVEQEAIFFYKTLTKILNSDQNREASDNYVIIPIREESPESLSNGKLVKLIDKGLRCDTDERSHWYDFRGSISLLQS